jgi:type I restriction enzyme, R subunit
MMASASVSGSTNSASFTPKASSILTARIGSRRYVVIAQINDLFSGDHPESSVRSVVTHVKDRLKESETLQQQAQNNSLTQFSASPDLQNEFVGAVIGAMDSSEDLSTQILNNAEIAQKLMGELVPIIFKTLQATA